MKTFAAAQGESGSGIWYLEWYAGPVSWKTQTRIPTVGPELHAWAPPAVVAWNGDDTRLDVIAVSSLNNHLVHVYKDNTSASSNAPWSEPEDLGGFITTPPALVSRKPGTLVCVFLVQYAGACDDAELPRVSHATIYTYYPQELQIKHTY